MRLALFDLDHTLLAGDSDVEWPRYLISKGLLDAEHAAKQNDHFYEQYKAGTLNMDEFLRFQLAPLARYSMQALKEMHDEYLRDHILPLIHDAARALVKKHLDQHDLVVIITATNRFVTGPIATEFGVEHLIATEAEIVDGRYTGQASGTPCFQGGKITRLDEWLAGRGQHWEDFDETWFYSDSRNDLPLLERASHPVAVNPDPVLRDVATERGWPILDLPQP